MPILSSHTPVTVRRVGMERLREALGWALGRQATCAIDNVLRSNASGQLILDGVWIAEQGGAAVGGVVRSLGRDRVAQLWEPGGRSTLVCDALQQVAVDESIADGAVFCQLLTATTPRSLQAITHYCDLLILARDVPAVDLPVRSSRLIYTSIGATSPGLTALLSRTFIGSSDAAGLHHLQTAAQSAAGLHDVADSGDRFWLMATLDDRPVGLLLLAEHNEMAAWEIAYLGLVPEVRGRGFGRELVREAVASVARSGGGLAFLAVDSGNDVARHVYGRAGFAIVDGKQVWIDQAAAAKIATVERLGGSSAPPAGAQAR